MRRTDEGEADVSKVWLLTEGDGEDGNSWFVIGIYSTREKAEKAKSTYDALKTHHRAVIEEWSVDHEGLLR